MMYYCLKKKEFKANLFELNRRGYKNYIYCRIGNQNGYIVGDLKILSELMNMSTFSVRIKEIEKVPLYKQSMDLQMGKTPKDTKEVYYSRTVNILPISQNNRYMTVWEIV